LPSWPTTAGSNSTQLQPEQAAQARFGGRFFQSLGEGDDMMKRVAGCLLTHLVLMVVSYMLAERCGDAVNSFAGIWFAVASSFLLGAAVVCLTEAIRIAGEGKGDSND